MRFSVIKNFGSERWTGYQRPLGVFRFCAGNDRLDVISGRCFHTRVCRVLCCWPWFHTMDDHGRIVQSRPSTCGHVHRRAHKLGGQFRRRHRLPTSKGQFKCNHHIHVMRIFFFFISFVYTIYKTWWWKIIGLHEYSTTPIFLLLDHTEYSTELDLTFIKTR